MTALIDSDVLVQRFGRIVHAEIAELAEKNARK